MLDLPDWSVIKTSLDGGQYEIEASYNCQPETCQKCGVVGELYRHGPKRVIYRDAPIRGHAVAIAARVQRYKCRACSGTFLQPLSGVDDTRRMTKRCVEYIEEQCLRDTFVRVAEHVGCHEKTVRNIAQDYIIRLESEYQMPRPDWLGIDEVMVAGGLRCVFTDVGRRTPVDIIADRGQLSVGRWLSRFPGRKDVVGVTMDMWRPYRDLVRQIMPHASIVVDKYHVLAMVNRSLDRVRKSIRESQSLKQRRALMRSRHVLMKRPGNLSDKQAFDLDGWLKNIPELAEAYELKEAFFRVYDMDKDAAREAFREWPNTVPDHLKEPFREITTAMGNWEPEILEYFSHPYTNAYTESLNGITKVMNRQGRGYTFDVLRAKVLFKKLPARQVGYVAATHRQAQPWPPYPSFRQWLKGIKLLEKSDGYCTSCSGQFPRSQLTVDTMPALVDGEAPKLAVMCLDCYVRFHTEREN